MKPTDASKSEKILRAIYELEKNKKSKRKITKEIVVIKAWKMFPSDFSMQGYLQYPNADISKYITSLFRKNLLKGGFHNYQITEKGKRFIEERQIKLNGKQKNKTNIKKTPRYIKLEITRILNSRVFTYFLRGEKGFLENDLFDFLGTSARSFKDSNRSNFLSQYNLMIKEVIPFCKENLELNGKMEKIVELWYLLENELGDILKR